MSSSKSRKAIFVGREITPHAIKTTLPRWTWDALHAICEREGVALSVLLSRAVRHYVNAEGFDAPTFKKPPMRHDAVKRGAAMPEIRTMRRDDDGRRGWLARALDIFKMGEKQ